MDFFVGDAWERFYQNAARIVGDAQERFYQNAARIYGDARSLIRRCIMEWK